MVASVSNPLHQKPSFRQEIRLGLVVFGGVSLAIYMNGICREFYEAVRGRGIYKLIKALTDSDIVVDIISGTSAGGINGVLLSYALTNSGETDVVDFEKFANIWRRDGDINALLRRVNPIKPPSNTSHKAADSVVDSILDGQGYYQDALFDAFNKAESKPAPDNEWASTVTELDLFVTGTDLLGKVYKAFDNTGRLIEVKDHRTVFLLKYRRGRKHDFAPDKINQAALAKLCRITSCFPVAFPVVTVHLDPDPRRPLYRAPQKSDSLDLESHAQLHRVPKKSEYLDYEIDKKLVKWGQLENRELPMIEPRDGYRLHFVDGGVLDNRPFSYTIREIYYRTASRPVERKLFYIDPSPDRFLDSPLFREMQKPNLLKVATDSLSGMPRYESIANDLKEIQDRNERVRRYKFLLDAFNQRVNDLDKQTDPDQPNDIPPHREQTYLRCRLVGLRDRVLPLILHLDQYANPEDQNKQQMLEEVAQLLTQYITEPAERMALADLLRKLGKQIRNLDVEYMLRKHFFLLDQLCLKMSKPKYEADYPALSQLADQVSRHIELLEVIRAALEIMLRLEAVNQRFCALIANPTLDRNTRREQIYQYLLRLHRYLLDVNDLSAVLPSARQLDQLEPIPATFFETLQPPISAKQITSAFEQLKIKARQLEDPDRLNPNRLESIWQNPRYEFDGSENDTGIYFSILRKVELATEQIIHTCPASIKTDLLRQFQNFRNVDLELYAFEYLADIHEKDLIEIFRIGPEDAKLGLGASKKSDEKLAGDQLRAFGGFFKKSWRSNDILWGRLDGLNRIVEALLTPEALQNFPRFLKRQQPLIDQHFAGSTAAYLEALVTDALPDSAPDQRQILVDGLLQLGESGDVHSMRLPSPSGKTKLETLQNLLVTAGHRAILATDLDNVIEDSFTEQLKWTDQPVTLPTLAQAAQPAHALSLRGPFDPSSQSLVSRRLAQDLLKDTNRETYFQNKYTVGAEKLEDIPGIVLKNILARTGLILRDVVITSGLGERLRRTMTYRVINSGLQFFYWSVRRNSPQALQKASPDFALNVGSLLLVVAALVSLVILAVSLIVTILRFPLWALTGIAVAVLLLIWLYLRLSSRPRR